MHRKTFRPVKTGLLFFFAALLIGCEKAEKQYDYSIFAFGTLIDVSLYHVTASQAETSFDLLQKDFDRYHQHWSPWTNGDLATLNTRLKQQGTHGKAITVPEHLIPLLERSIALSLDSDNFYNPAIGNLINLWQFHKYQDEGIQPPEDQKIQSLIKKNPRLSDLIFDKNNRIINTNPAVSLNFGAFAKGYAIALEIEQLQKQGVHNAVINAGGDLCVIGKHGDRLWNIGIRHPREDSILASIEVKHDECIFTSGDYERSYTFQGKRYHHILDPRTGYPTNDAQSVTVLHPNAGLADAAATAIFVAGSKNWQRIANSMGIQYVLLIDSAGNLHLTPAMEKRLKFINKSPASHIIVSKEL